MHISVGEGCVMRQVFSYRLILNQICTFGANKFAVVVLCNILIIISLYVYCIPRIAKILQQWHALVNE